MFTLNYFLALFLTLFLEIIIGLIFGFRRKIEITNIILVNLVTHPFLNYVLFVLNYYFLIFRKTNIFWTFLIVLEIIVILIENFLLRYALPCQNKRKILFLTITMNVISFIVFLFFT